MQASYQLVTVFAKSDSARGNQAAIFLAENNNGYSYEQQVDSGLELADNLKIETRCFISAINADEYRVQCFNGKNKIQCCGHGMVAAAETVFNKNHQSEIIINENIIASRVSDEKKSQLVKLKLPRLDSFNQAVPGWVSELFSLEHLDITPAQAAVSKSEDGYLLLEFNDSTSNETFRLMQPDLKRICSHTQRAVVVIYFDKNNQHLYMRYFAPQYGTSEDSATGSVLRFVADYIKQQYGINQFEVSQCSPAGGFMQVACDKETVSITANASTECKHD